MAAKGYGQYCGLSRALELLGERWALLIVRDLLSGPHRFADLEASLVGIPTSVLTNRLKELETAGLITRVPVHTPRRGTAYTLTDDGLALEPTLVELGRWGGSRMGGPRDGEVVTAESLAMALRTTFRPDRAAGMDRELGLVMGDIVLTVTIRGADLDVTVGGAATPASVLHATPQIKRLIDGNLTPEEAVVEGVVRVDGDPSALDDFASVFRLD